MDTERAPEPESDRFPGYPRPLDAADAAALEAAAKARLRAPEATQESFGMNAVRLAAAIPTLLLLIVSPPFITLLLLATLVPFLVYVLTPRGAGPAIARAALDRRLAQDDEASRARADLLRGAMLVPGRVVLASPTRGENGGAAVDLTVRYHLGGAFRETRHEMPYEGAEDLNMKLVPVLLLRDATPMVLVDHLGRGDIR